MAKVLTIWFPNELQSLPGILVARFLPDLHKLDLVAVVNQKECNGYCQLV